MDWLQRITDSLTERTGVSGLMPDGPTRKAILDVARIASHTSGDRINAPLLCYVLGSLTAQGAPLDECIAIVEAGAGAGAGEA